jgi:drug/metabolite transporter (DMT)-like permease
MKKWFMYSLIVVIIYTLWTLLYEQIIKKQDDCFCMPLKIYMIVGILAFLFFLYHVKNECKHACTIKENIMEKTSFKGYSYIFIIAILILLSNRFILNAIIDKGNSGYVYSIANTYIIVVTLISAYMSNTTINKKDIIGIFAILTGTTIISF